MPPVLGKSRFVPIAGSTEDAWPFSKQPVFCPADADGWHVPKLLISDMIKSVCQIYSISCKNLLQFSTSFGQKNNNCIEPNCCVQAPFSQVVLND